ncbi:C40 family peptidase [Agromyces sp. SYSU T0242]|uniref:C40 family peptidase n=1 Tax=Agromyces litoreus TaxID=3158561 RepID=UPI003395EED5
MARFPRRRSGALTAPKPKARTAVVRRDAVQAPAEAPARPQKDSLGRRLRRGGAKNVLVMSVAAGLVGTLAIPAYAFAPGSDGIQFGATAATQLTKAAPQDVEVAEDVIAAPVSEDSYDAVTGEEIRAAEEAKRAAEEAARAAAEAEAARQAAAAEMTSYAAAASEYSAPAAVYGSADPASVYSVAQQYLGVPYVYGGATPAGFDCSGLVQYVYAQFGISLPHSSSAQGAAGTQIPLSQAVPGDLVVMSGHIGFYAGNGMILHAPYEGTVVRVQPIWTSDYWIVRI